MPTQKEAFLGRFEHEHKITKRVLEALPKDKLDFRPHKKSRDARELASLFAAETSSIPAMISKMKVEPTDMRKINDKTLHDIVAEYEKSHKDAVEAVKKTPDDNFAKEVDFFGWKTTLSEALWEFVLDQIHHRGQLSVYLRMTDAKVPPIYGPTADYPNGEADLK